MARQENDLTCCMVTQALQPEYWKWDQNELKAIRSGSIKDITDVIKSRLTVSGYEPAEMYSIVHDQDTVMDWDDVANQQVVAYKTHHIHSVIKFKAGHTATIFQIAHAVGLEPQFVEKAQRGRYGYDNMLAYLIHIKDIDKHQYEPSEVFTSCGRNYSVIYALRQEEWLKGRAKKTASKAKVDIDWLESKILSGEVVKSQIILTDEYFEIYARNKRRCEDALDTFGQRKTYRTIQKMEAGEFKVSVIFVTGRSSAGKSRCSDAIIKDIKERVLAQTGEKWTMYRAASSNPYDNYHGEEILLMDDLRGMALTASD